MSAPLLVVHLVHGTWGRGVWPVIREELGWPPKAQSAYWFEEGSKFRSEVARRLEDVEFEFEFRQFTWSGSNSFGSITSGNRPTVPAAKSGSKAWRFGLVTEMC